MFGDSAKMKSGTAVLAAAADIRKARNSAMTNLSCKPILAYLIPRIRSWHPRALEERATWLDPIFSGIVLLFFAVVLAVFCWKTGLIGHLCGITACFSKVKPMGFMLKALLFILAMIQRVWSTCFQGRVTAFLQLPSQLHPLWSSKRQLRQRSTRSCCNLHWKCYTTTETSQGPCVLKRDQILCVMVCSGAFGAWASFQAIPMCWRYHVFNFDICMDLLNCLIFVS